jgi:hypothetical protein
MAYANGSFANNGDAKTSTYICRGVTTNDSPTYLTLGVYQYPTSFRTNYIAITTNSTWTFDILVTARTASGAFAGFNLRGMIDGSAGIVGSPAKTEFGTVPSGWDVNLAHDGGALKVLVTGPATDITRWIANVRTVEVSY